MRIRLSYLLTTLVAVTCAGAVGASPAMAGWTASRAVAPGVDPVLAFGPSGDAAIGSTVFSSCHDVVGTYLTLRPVRGAFGPAVSLAPRHGNCGDWPGLLAIALPSDGATVALLGPLGADEQPIDAFARARGAGGFGAPQQLVPLGNANGDDPLPNATAVLDTARGEVVEVGEDDATHLSTATLEPGSTHFTVSPHAPAGLTNSDFIELATDGAGGAFMAGDGSNGCTTVAYRPAYGAFSTTYRSAVCGDKLRNVVQGIAATGDGYAALLSESLDETGTGTSSLWIQVGRFGRFRAPVLLSSVVGRPFGVATARDGAATVAWTGCTPGPVLNDLLTLPQLQRLRADRHRRRRLQRAAGADRAECAGGQARCDGRGPRHRRAAVRAPPAMHDRGRCRPGRRRVRPAPAGDRPRPTARHASERRPRRSGRGLEQLSRHPVRGDEGRVSAAVQRSAPSQWPGREPRDRHRRVRTRRRGDRRLESVRAHERRRVLADAVTVSRAASRGPARCCACARGSGSSSA